MRILYLGDLMARPGRLVAEAMLPKLHAEFSPDLVVAQAENVTHGKSMSVAHMRELQRAGIDFFTGGNHSPERPDLHPLLANPAEPVLAPANMEAHPTAWGVKEFATTEGAVLFVSLLGQTVPSSPPMRNPLQAIDEILAARRTQDYAAIVVNFHGDYSSEKRVIGYYLDGRVSAVIGDHWHVPTADAMLLPSGTAHLTDVGMCGTLHSSLGVELTSIIPRWRDEVTNGNRIAEAPPYQCNAVLIDTDGPTRSKKIQAIHQRIENLE